MKPLPVHISRLYSVVSGQHAPPPATTTNRVWVEGRAGDILVPVPTDDHPAPATITDLVSAGRPTAGPTVPAGLRI